MNARTRLLTLSPALLGVTAISPLEPGQLVLRNTTWDRVEVEVRVGPSTTCGANPIGATRFLTRDQNWAVVSEEVICWRREETPGDTARVWTPWESVRLATDEIREVTL